MPGLISICIPSRDRPKLLTEAVQSCFTQAYRPLEVLVGDDSAGNESRQAIADFAAPEGIALRYIRNRPPPGQAGNVNALFAAAAGDRLVLLHDDDLLPAEAVDCMAEAWSAHADVAAVFGKHYMIAESGETLEQATEGLNRAYCRTPENAGPLASAVVAALRQQFPGAGYLVKTDVARATGFRPPSIVSEFCDMDFGVRLALAAEPSKFVYVDSYTYKYRQTRKSIARSADSGTKSHMLYEALSNLEIPREYSDTYHDTLHKLAIRAVPSYIRFGQRRRALKVYLSSDYGHARLSARGMYHFLAVLAPWILRSRRARSFRT